MQIEEGEGRLDRLKIAFGRRQDELCIMRVQEVEHHLRDLLPVVHGLAIDLPNEALGLLMAPQEIILDTFRKGIVHHRMKLITIEPWLGRMPDFPENIEVWLLSQDRLTEISPELMIDFISHIQPPSIDIKLFNPVCRNLQKIGLHLWISRIELRHIARKGKSMVRQVATIPQIF